MTESPKLAAPAQRALANAGIQQLEQLTKLSEAEVRQLHGIGPNALDQLRIALSAKGLSFNEAMMKNKNEQANPKVRKE